VAGDDDDDDDYDDCTNSQDDGDCDDGDFSALTDLCGASVVVIMSVGKGVIERTVLSHYGHSCMIHTIHRHEADVKAENQDQRTYQGVFVVSFRCEK
jgi:hypothetical protein